MLCWGPLRAHTISQTRLSWLLQPFQMARAGGIPSVLPPNTSRYHKRRSTWIHAQLGDAHFGPLWRPEVPAAKLRWQKSSAARSIGVTKLHQRRLRRPTHLQAVGQLPAFWNGPSEVVEGQRQKLKGSRGRTWTLLTPRLVKGVCCLSMHQRLPTTQAAGVSKLPYTGAFVIGRGGAGANYLQAVRRMPSLRDCATELILVEVQILHFSRGSALQ